MRHSIGDKVHIWDGANIVADVDNDDITVYVRGINLIYANDGDKTYYHFNAHGDVVVLTNESGNKTKSYSYNAFGVEYNEATLDNNPFRYCGEYYDKETKTIYLRARYYNAAQGRFTQQDGWEYANPQDPLSLNLYTYCWNNPIKYTDSNGHYVRNPDYYLLKEDGLGGAGGGGALLVVTEYLAQLVEKADQGLATVGNALSNTWNSVVNFCATQVDNIARIAADGKQALKNTIDKIAQDFNNNTTNPPDPSNLPDPNDKWDIHNLKPGDTWVNGQSYNGVMNSINHIFRNNLHDHKLDDFLQSFNNDKLSAYEAMTKAAQDYTNAMGLSNEKFIEKVCSFTINGFDVLVEFSNINGFVRVTSAYIP